MAQKRRFFAPRPPKTSASLRPAGGAGPLRLRSRLLIRNAHAFRQRETPAQTVVFFFECFPYVCPEPVLVK